MNPAEQIRTKARQLGFAHCGFTKAGSLESLRPFYEQFLSERDFSGINYLDRYKEQRLNPDLLLPGVKSVIAVLMSYYPEELLPEENNFIISVYAYGKGYQPIMKEKLSKLTGFISTTFPGEKSLAYCDSGPVMEKLWAQRCGVGWQGKNTIVINGKEGSFFFIGILLTTLDVEPDPPAVDRCGNCTRCMDACPTGALQIPYRLDINRCISYHTIVNRGDIPDTVREKLTGRIFGCDICQEACPFNRTPKPNTEPAFRILPGLAGIRRTNWLSLTEEEFNRIFRGSEIRHTGYKTIRRNMELAGEITGGEKDQP